MGDTTNCLTKGGVHVYAKQTETWGGSRICCHRDRADTVKHGATVHLPKPRKTKIRVAWQGGPEK